MRLEHIRIRNFRLLRRFAIDLAKDNSPTVLVGSNNSGKTSVMDALRLFVGSPEDARKIALHDLCQRCQAVLPRLEQVLANTPSPEKKIEILRRFAPKMRMDLTFSYSDDAADVVVASDLLMSLEGTSDRVCLRVEYRIENAKGLLDEFEARRNKNESLLEFLREKYRDYFGRAYFKISEDGKQIEELENGGILKRLLKIDIVSAQRHVDDDENRQATKISRLLHEHYTNYYKVDDADGYFAIEDALKDSASDLTDKYIGAFERLTKRLKGYGYPTGQQPPDLRIRAEMSSETLYKDNTRIYYANEFSINGGPVQQFELPEKYNGLGYKNLIYIVLQLESFRAAIEADPVDRPRVHIIAIEEPEAHLHPQMQCVFISEISKALESGDGVTAQAVLSTHSAHILANSGFEPVRYFRRSGREVVVRDLSRLPIETSDPSVLAFLRRYVKLTHCDLFFADKAVFVEGQVERLLLPLMIEECSNDPDFADFRSQYISISEIGGAYAHKFRPIIEFLGIPTLIITDLDAIDGNGEKCQVSMGVGTSNVCLRTWLPNRQSVSDLHACTADDKTQWPIRVAYQTHQGGQCGRSFEEAFVYANISWITANYAQLTSTSVLMKRAVDIGLVAEAWKLSNKLDKVDFALDLLAASGWETPAYIMEGLQWLAREEAV